MNETVTPPVTPVPPNPPPAPKKSNGLVWILVVLVFLLSVITGFFIWQNMQLRKQLVIVQPTLQPVIQSTPDSVASSKPVVEWETFTNSKYKYSFQYDPTFPSPTVLLDDKSRGFKTSGYDQVITGGCVSFISAYKGAKKISELSSSDLNVWDRLDELLALKTGETLQVYEEKQTDTFTYKVTNKRLSDISLAGAVWAKWQVYDNFENTLVGIERM